MSYVVIAFVDKRMAFALGGPTANVIAAFVGLFVLGLTQFDLPISAATSFAVSRLWTGLTVQDVGRILA